MPFNLQLQSAIRAAFTQGIAEALPMFVGTVWAAVAAGIQFDI